MIQPYLSFHDFVTAYPRRQHSSRVISGNADSALSLSVADAFLRVFPGDLSPTAIFRITLSSAHAEIVKVCFTTRDGTALDALGYYTAQEGEVFLLPGQTSVDVLVDIPNIPREYPSFFFLDVYWPRPGHNILTRQSGLCTIPESPSGDTSADTTNITADSTRIYVDRSIL